MSFATAVTTEGSVVSAIAERPRRSRARRPTSSATKCCASAAEPPLPKASTRPPASRLAAMRPPPPADLEQERGARAEEALFQGDAVRDQTPNVVGVHPIGIIRERSHTGYRRRAQADSLHRPWGRG